MTPDHSMPGPLRQPAPSSAPNTQDFAELVKTVRSLRLLMNLSLAVLVVFIVLVNAYMLFQVRSLRRQGAELRPTVAEMARTIGEYETNSVPVMQRFTVELRRFAERNPDFAPILNRYAGAMAAGTPTNTPPKAASGPPPSGARK